MKENFLLAITAGIIVSVAALFIEDRFFNTEPVVQITQLQTYRDLGGIAPTPVIENDAEVKKAATPAPVDSPISVNIQYLYRQKYGKAFKTLTNDTVLHSGDYYKVVFTPTETTYFYIFQKGSSGNIYRLFPMKDFKGVTVNNHNPIQANVAHSIPAKDKSFFLDNQTGKESIYVIVSRQKDEILENQYQQVLIARQEQNQEKIEHAQTTLDRAIKMRDISGIVDDLTDTKFSWREADQQFSTILARLKSCDGCASTLSFWHR